MATGGVEEPPRRIRDFSCVGNADTRGDTDPRTSFSWSDAQLGSAHEVGAIVRARDLERTRRSARSVRADVVRDADERLDTADEHGVPASFAVANDVEAIVHAVDQEHVRVSGRSIERARAFRQPNARMTRAVGRASVRFGLDDPRRARSVHEHGADESARHDVTVTAPREGDSFWKYLHRPETQLRNPHGRPITADDLIALASEILPSPRMESGHDE